MLDANAGLPSNIEDLQLFTKIASSINNIHGFTNEKIMYHQMIQNTTKQLLEKFNFSHIYIQNSTTQFLQEIHNKNNNIYVYPGQHPKIQQIFENKVEKGNTCLINLLTSEQNLIQTDQLEDARKQGYPYIIIDATQAFGRLQLPNDISCLIISPKKVGGIQGISFIFMTEEFKQKYYPDKKFIIDNAPLYLASIRCLLQNYDYNKQQNEIMYNSLIEQLKKFTDYIQIIEPKKEHTYTSILFELKDQKCTKQFQKLMDDNGFQVGAETACKSNNSNIVRLSWRQPIPDIDITDALQNTFDQMNNIEYSSQDEYSQDQTDNNILEGSGYILKIQNMQPYDKQQAIYNLKMFNQQKFYVRNHWANNHDKHDSISSKYLIMFQDFILQQKQTYYLYIPELMDSYKKYIKNIKSEDYKMENIIKQKSEDYKIEDLKKEKSEDDDTDQNREEFEYIYRVSKNIYLTPFEKEDILQLKDFKFDEQTQTYPNLPPEFLQLYKNTNDKKTKQLYYMTYYKYKQCKQNQYNLEEEYINNPLSKYIIQLKLPIQEYFINDANSYKNKKIKVIKSEEYNKNAIQVIQPGKQYQNESAIDLIEEMPKDLNIVLIVHNPSTEQQQKILSMNFKVQRETYTYFHNWYQIWYYDDNIYTYIRGKYLK